MCIANGVASVCCTNKRMKQSYALQLSHQIGEENMFVWPKGVSPSVQMNVFPQRTCEAYERGKLQFGIVDLQLFFFLLWNLHMLIDECHPSLRMSLMFTSALSTDCPGLWQMIAGLYYACYGNYSWQLLYISSQGYNDMARCSTYCNRLDWTILRVYMHVHSHEYEAASGLDILMPVETQHPHQFHL